MFSFVLARLLQSSVGDMPADYARRVLAADFTTGEVARHRELAERSPLGTLTQEGGIDDIGGFTMGCVEGRGG